LIKEGFKKVVISNLDPNPAVNGKGVELLRAHGIEVVYGILSDEGEKLNEVFFLSQRKKRPFFHFKSAVTLDGKTALTNGESKWITGEAARLEVHRMRSLHQAILVGGETARKDNPKLTVRLPGHEGQMPWRIVVSKSGELPVTHHLFSDDFAHRTIFYTQNDSGFNFPGKVMVNSLQDVLDDLFQRKIISVMVECGPILATEFLKSGFIDRMTLFQSPSILGVGRNLFDDINLLSLDKRPLLTDIESRWIGNDHALTGRLKCLQD
jgi:diaminohydroxyphosphoribosylaminopyrimidine deaminase/5-amino-6-(5-phosphoribosylamino)uracil reductase